MTLWAIFLWCFGVILFITLLWPFHALLCLTGLGLEVLHGYIEVNR